MEGPLLTIVIPTFNRANYLDKCLNSVTSQINDYNEIELIVANNASTDNSDSIVQKYMLDGNVIKCIKRTENIGPDRNFADSFRIARGKYFWIIGDDDFLIPNTLNELITILKEEEEYGIIYLKGRVYYNDAKELQQINLTRGLYLKKEVFNDPITFFLQYNYWATFVTASIVNRSLVIPKIDPFEFEGTSLIQLGWNIPSVFAGKKNLIVNDKTIVCKTDNTGGYKLYEVFGKKFNLILDALIKKGFDPKIKTIVNNHLLSSFFPSFIKLQSGRFEKENYVKILFPIYWKNKLFWKKIMWPYFKSKLKPFKLK
jgi:glycosyltransferase involved in cell wall biosynthesis